MSGINESFLASEGARDIEQSGKPAGSKNCLNCGTELKGVFCHVCGQKDLPKRQSTGQLLSNFIESFSNFEGKFFQTTKQLLLRPGFLALEYTAGKRERYFHPVRMYAFISFVFFLIFFSLPDDEAKEKDVVLSREDSVEIAKDPKAFKEKMSRYGVDTDVFDVDSTAIVPKRDSTRKKGNNTYNFSLTKSDYSTVKAYDSAQAALPEAERDGWFERRMTRRGIELNEKYSDKPGQFGMDFYKASLENFSSVLFFLLPVFALLLKLLYIRRNYYFSEHLVFSIYFYNFFYFAGSLMMLVGLVDSLDWLFTSMGWGIYVYLLFSMKRMYKQGWIKTTAKFALFSFIFAICFFTSYLINAFLVVMIL